MTENLGKRLYANLQGDKVIWMIVFILSLFSILAVYSATGALAFRYRGGDTEAFLFKHLGILGLGLFLMWLGYKMHYMRYNIAAPYLLVLAVPLLLYTILLGEDVNQARRWIELPYVGLTFQTSDFAKFALILWVAREITRRKDYITEFKDAFLPIIVPILLICGLIAPADLSTAMLLFTTCAFMMFIGRVSLKYIGLLAFLWMVVFTFLITLGQFFPEVVRSETWINRVAEFRTDPDGGFQVEQAKIAIANGEWFGVGMGNSTQRNFLPAPYADFIYAIICEEYGLVGAYTLLMLYLMFLFRGVRLLTLSDKSFGAMAAIGFVITLVVQALVNMAVSVHLIPVTGVTLPMVSMGGTSLIFTCLFFGVILSVSKAVESGRGSIPKGERSEGRSEGREERGEGRRERRERPEKS